MKFAIVAIPLAIFLATSQTLAAETAFVVVDSVKGYTSQLLVNVNDTHGCGGTAGNKMYRIPQENESQVRVALAAFLSGRQVRIVYDCAASGQTPGAYVSIIEAN